MACHHVILFSILFLLSTRTASQQLQHSQTQTLQQLRKQLEYPKQLDPWNNLKDLCIVPPSPSLSLTCEGTVVTELKIVGDNRPVGSTQFYGHPLPNSTLSLDFSIDSFVTTLTRLSSLKVVILVSLGMWGPLPDKIHRLYGLEVLDLSSNYLYGSVPPKIARMGKLQTFTLDANFFNGTVPDWFPSLSNLKVLSLKNNRLEGSLPKTIGNVRTLDTLAISSNNISGELPDLSGLRSLQVLDLRENDIGSNLPTFPVGLITILLSGNSLNGEVPSQLGKLRRLQHLDLSRNLLEGHLPAELFSLPNISYLNLASNMLSGSLPKDLACSNQLGFIDISSNRFVGTIPSCLNTNLNKRVVKLSNNCLKVGSTHQHVASFCTETARNRSDSKGKHNNWTLVGVIGGIFFFVFLLVLVFVIFFTKRVCHGAGEEQILSGKHETDGSSMGFSTELLASARSIPEKQKLGMQLLPLYRQFTLEELEEATKNFGPSSFISEGSTGKFYKGRLENGSYVVVRCLSMFKRDSVRNLKLRLDLLSKLRHPNLVCLLGHCIDKPGNSYSVKRVLLVYEYIPNGNLRSLLSANNSKGRPLPWSDRLEIMIGIAKAVHFLHTGIIPGFFSNKLTTTSILVDEHYMPKVSDYGLSIIMEEIDKHERKTDDQKSSRADQGATNLDDDVHGLGFILLEMLVGPSMIEKGEAFFLTKMAEASNNQEELNDILDPMVQSTASQTSLSTVISVTNKCVSPHPSFRPSIEDVLWNLQYAEQVHTSAHDDLKSDTASQA